MQVYDALAEHQQKNAAGWDMAQLIQDLHRWKEIFCFEFKLQLPPVAFCVKHTTSNCYGYFRPGHNEFGLTREIAINKAYLDCRERWQTLGTLLHELLHAWQDLNGKRGKGNYHNTEFRAKADSYGLIVDSRGCTQYAPLEKSLFLQTLQKHDVGIEIPELPVPVTFTGPGSNLKKWSCGCTNVRVAVADFRALCLKCNRKYSLAR